MLLTNAQHFPLTFVVLVAAVALVVGHFVLVPVVLVVLVVPVVAVDSAVVAVVAVAVSAVGGSISFFITIICCFNIASNK